MNKAFVFILAIIVLLNYEAIAQSMGSSCRPLDCGRISGKLCCNGKMYENLCALYGVACAAGDVPLKKFCLGKYTHVDPKNPDPNQCQKLVPPGGTSCQPMDCEHNIGKVCCNGKTYQNLCALNKAACDAEKFCLGPHTQYDVKDPNPNQCSKTLPKPSRLI